MNTASAPILSDALAAPPPALAPAAPPPRPRPREATAWPVAILGVPFDPVTTQGAIARIEAMIASRRPHYIVTANVDFLVQAHRDVELRRILLEADLTLCDGTPLLWASRWLGNALPERVAGSDLAPLLMATAAAKGHRVFFLGAAPGVAEEATRRLREQFPAINIVGHYAPPYAALLEMDHAQIAQRIREAKPDILLVGFGCPKQEKWIAMHHRALGVPVAIGVGATIDFLAGRVKRAPDWMRRSGTEWVFRLAQEPRRLFRRYANDLVYFLPTFAVQALRLAGRGTTGGAPAAGPVSDSGWINIDAGKNLTRRALEAEAAFWRELCEGHASAPPPDPAARSHYLLHCGQLRHIDGTGVAFLLQWRKTLRTHGRQLVLLAPSPALRRTLAALRLTDHFLVAHDAPEAARQVETLAGRTAVQQDGKTRSLAWCGEVIAANADDVWRMTSEHVKAFAAAGATLVIIDLAQLRFIDSSGAALMLRLKQWARELPTQILFTQAQPNVRNVLRLTRLDQLLLEGGQ
jgi:N-acetylglucosaminyldiphosphoundecaprenol N-acetyl-beta-D-mannosaminyltransferase